MDVDLAGPCSVCQTPVDAETGVCAEGHDDLTRADAARLLNAGAVGFVDVDAVAEGVADVARALGLSEAEADALCRAAGIDPETGYPR